MIRLCASAIALGLAVSTAQAASLDRLTLQQTVAGQVYQFQTDGPLYQARVVDPKTGECEMRTSRDGQHFGKAKRVYLLGATPGKQAGFTIVLMHQVKLGVGMELGIENLEEANRHVTPSVTSIELLPAEAVEPAAESRI